jgi:Flp pilus assembly protein TadD
MPENRRGDGGVSMNRTIIFAAMAAVLAVSGCQSSSIDTAMTTAVQSNADISAADLNAGKAQFNDGNYGLAEKHFRKAVELRASNAEAWMGLAAAYDQLGRFDFADRAYDQLLKVAGRRPQIVNNMGYSQYLRGNKKEAKKLLIEARKGMTDTTVVDANLELLNKG